LLEKKDVDVQEVGTSRLLFEEVSGEKLLLSEEAEQLKILLKREIQKLDGELRAKVRSGDRLSYKLTQAEVAGLGSTGSASGSGRPKNLRIWNTACNIGYIIEKR
jgi:hypothetical protein